MLKKKSFFETSSRLADMSEDYVAVPVEHNRFLISKIHLIGVSVTLILSAVFVLPMPNLLNLYAIDSKVSSEDYLNSNDALTAAQMIVSNDGSLENYEDFQIPANMFSDEAAALADADTDLGDSDLGAAASMILSGQDQDKEVKNVIADTPKPEAVKEEPQVLPRPKNGKWYIATIKRGDTFASVFKRLSLPYATVMRLDQAGTKRDLAIRPGDELQILIDKQNNVLELVKGLDKRQQVRFTRMNSEQAFTAVHEPLNSHVKHPGVIDKYADAGKMPQVVAAAKAKAEQEKQAAAKRQAAEAQLAEVQAQTDTGLRPRLIVVNLKRGENFDAAAKRAGLTAGDIRLLKRQFAAKIPLTSLRRGDSVRVLFNEIGSNALINAAEVNSARKGKHALFRNPNDKAYYAESGYKPASGVFRRFPLAINIKINSPFNPARRNPVTRRVAPHEGVDIKAPIGTPVFAPADGIVTFAGYQHAAGYYMIVRHKGPYSTVYMHLSKLGAGKGQRVKAGDIIAKTGNTGRSTGPHLHYEVRVNGRPLNPLKVALPRANRPMLAKQQQADFKDAVNVYKRDLYRQSLAKQQSTTPD